MTENALNKVIKSKVDEHQPFINFAELSERYYENENDITFNKSPSNESAASKTSDVAGLRSADNRVSHNWHQLLVDQKVSYALTYPPTFDVDDETLNKEISAIIGSDDDFAKESKDLAIHASNTGKGWLHYWVDEQTRKFDFASVDSKQVIPIYNGKLKSRLVGLIRSYVELDEEDLKEYTVYEYWTDDTLRVSRKLKTSSDFDTLQPHNVFNVVDISTGDVEGSTNEYKHGLSEIPFIEFPNNSLKKGDLHRYKSLIDIYDKVFSGFVNDVEDMQEIILVLTNYGGTDLKEFKDDLKKFKAIKVNSDGSGDDSGVDKLEIEIPVEARKVILEMTKEQIFVSGQGVNPNQELSTSVSGVALKQIYSLLELRTSMMESEFRIGYSKLVKAILRFLGKEPDDYQVKQTWTRTKIDNDLEQSQVIRNLAPFTSDENLAKSNPIVEDWEAELTLQKEEAASSLRMEDDYLPNATAKVPTGTDKDVIGDGE